MRIQGLEIVAAHICDDIREEVGGKSSLMGLLPGEILVPAFPAALWLSFYFECFNRSDDTLSLKVEVNYGNGSLPPANLQIPPGPDPAVVVLGRASVLMRETGTLVARISVNGGRPTTVIKKGIMTPAEFEQIRSRSPAQGSKQ